jgi:hypothetical protein
MAVALQLAEERGAKGELQRQLDVERAKPWWRRALGV